MWPGKGPMLITASSTCIPSAVGLSSQRNTHKACQHLAVCLGTRISRNLPECFPHATRPVFQHLHTFLVQQSQTLAQKNPSGPGLGGELKFEHLLKLKGGTWLTLRDMGREGSSVTQRLPSRQAS